MGNDVKSEFVINFEWTMYQFNKSLVKWAMRKYKKLKGHKTRAGLLMQTICKRQPARLYHWSLGVPGAFSSMS